MSCVSMVTAPGDQLDRPAHGKLHQLVALYLIPNLRIREQALCDGFLQGFDRWQASAIVAPIIEAAHIIIQDIKRLLWNLSPVLFCTKSIHIVKLDTGESADAWVHITGHCQVDHIGRF